MASNRSSAATTRRRSSGAGARKKGMGAMRAFTILAGLVVVGVIAIIALSDIFEKGIQEVTLPLKHENVIRQQADEKGVDAALIAAVIYNESRFYDQTSHADARGLMQITPQTAEEIE